MMPGGMTTSPPGDHDSFIRVLNIRDLANGLGAVVEIGCETGYGDRFVPVFADGKKVTIVYVPEEQTVNVQVPYDSARTNHAVTVGAPMDWDNDHGVDLSFFQTYFESDKGGWVEIEWDASMEVLEAYGDSAQLSGWTLSGLNRFATARPYQRKTMAQVDITISNSGTTRTVTLSLNGYTLATGSRSGDGEITLAEQNDSGVSGTVTIAYTADVAEGDAYLVGRWAESYTVQIGDESVTVQDSGLGERLSAKLGPFDADTYAWSITPVSDTGVNGTAATGNVTVPGRPEPPGVPEYVSGNYAATVIQWSPSGTGGATYRVYVSDLDGAVDMDAVFDTVAAGGDPRQATLDFTSLGGTGAGFRRIVVESVNGGIESGVRRQLVIEYDSSGDVILPRPNVPGFQLRANSPVTSGRTINVSYTYDSANAKAVATKVRLDIKAEDGTVTTGTPANLGTPINGVYRGTISATASANGYFQYRVVALTAGNVESDNSDYSGPVPVSNTVMDAPSDVETNVIV